MSALTKISYPYFRKGQVLKNTDLNNMVGYLDQQNRFTRALVIGTGIFSGLQVDIIQDNDPSVKLIIHQGFGLSSDGYILQMKNDDPNVPFVYSGYQKVNLSESEFRCKNSNGTNSPEPATWDVFKLIEQKVMESTKDETLIPLISLADEYNLPVEFCIILWISREEKDRPFCIDVCDETGGDLSFSVIPLLVKKSDIFKNGSLEETISKGFKTPPQIKIHPFGFGESSENEESALVSKLQQYVDPSLIEDHTGFKENYVSIINYAIASVTEAYNWVYEYMYHLGLEGEVNPFLSLTADLKKILDQLSGTVTVPTLIPLHVEIQYLYQYLHDLKKAYEEFVSSSNTVNAAILPDLCSYPRSVCLGGLSISNSATLLFIYNDSCRTSFQPSMFYEANNSRIREIEFYYTRLKKLTSICLNNDEGFVELPLPETGLKEIRVTPGRSMQMPLSKQSIPYYFKAEIKNYWNYWVSEYCPDPKILSYHDMKESQAQNPLVLQDDEFNFYRIEGHIGHKTGEASEFLEKLKDKFNLPFSIKIVYLNMTESGRKEYESAEMNKLREKYDGIRNELIKYYSVKNLIPPGIDVLPLNITDFECFKLSNWFKSHPYEIIKDEEFSPDCILHSLQILRMLFDLESSLWKNLFTFSEFAGAHPGLQHLGGVQKGGTFVLVNAIFMKKEAEDLILANTRLQKDKRYNRMITINQTAVDQYVEENAVQMVVGDFALPYQYCDKGRTVDPLILLIPDKFCSNDAQSYTIWLFPAGGTIRGIVDGEVAYSADLPDYISFDESIGKYLFYPAKVPISEEKTLAEVMISYHTGGLHAKTLLTVYLKPEESSIALTNEPLFNDLNLLISQKITFTASVKSGFVAYWMIDGVRIANESGTTPIKLVREFFYQNKTQYIISHVVCNVFCETRMDVEINLCNMTGDISMQFEGPPRFTEDPENDEWVGITFTPQGGRFRMWRAFGEYFEPNIQVLKEEDGTLKYRLINSAKNPLPAGQYSISYYLPVCGQETIPVDFYVQNEPFIILNRYVFCSCDRQRYPIFIHPSDSQLVANPDEGLIKEDNLYFFDPSAVITFNKEDIAIIALNLSVEGGGNVIRKLTIYKVPHQIILKDAQPIFEGEKCFLTGYNFIFSASDGKAARFEWQLDDETMSIFNQNEIFECKITLGRKHVVKLATMTILPNDENPGIHEQPRLCQNEMIYDIKDLCPDSRNLKISVKNIDEVMDSYIITVLPVGGKFSMEPVPKDSGTTIEEPPIFKYGEEPCNKTTTYHFSIADIDYKKFFPKGIFRIVYSFPDCNIAVGSDPIKIPEPVMGPESIQKKNAGRKKR